MNQTSGESINQTNNDESFDDSNLPIQWIKQWVKQTMSQFLNQTSGESINQLITQTLK